MLPNSELPYTSRNCNLRQRNTRN